MKIEAIIKNNPGVPHLFKGHKILILDCIEINEEEEIYMYFCRLDYHGQIFETYINSEDLEII